MGNGHQVGAGGQLIDGVATGRVGEHRPLFAAGDIRHADACPWQNAAGLVGDLTAERIGERRGWRGEE